MASSVIPRAGSANERAFAHPNGVGTTAWPSENGASAATGATDALARNLGWFSLGLGLAQLFAPRQVARLAGFDDRDSDGIIRLIGLREIGSGVGLLTQAKPTPWLWSRVGGDAMDLMLLGRALESPESRRGRLLLATAAVLGITAADTMASIRMAGEPDEPYAARHERPVRATAAVTINAPASEVYSWWQGFQRLPQFMKDAAAVEVTGDGTSRWTFSAPAGVNVAWDVVVTKSRPNEQISWRTGEGSPISGSGRVRLRTAPGDQGTEVVFDAEVHPPAGTLGKTVGGILAQALGAKLTSDLRRLKQLIELGEIVQSDDSIVPGPNPAQPPKSIPASQTGSANAA